MSVRAVELRVPVGLARTLRDGEAAFARSDYSEALAKLDEVTLEEPRSIPGLVYRACTAWALGFQDDAIATLQRAILAGRPWQRSPACGLRELSRTHAVLLAQQAAFLYIVPSNEPYRGLMELGIRRAKAGDAVSASIAAACINDAGNYRLVAALDLTFGLNLAVEIDYGPVSAPLQDCLKKIKDRYQFTQLDNGLEFFFPRDRQDRIARVPRS